MNKEIIALILIGAFIIYSIIYFIKEYINEKRKINKVSEKL